MEKIDISINITLHHEGLIFKNTFRSIKKQIDYLVNSKKRITYEINVSLDSPNKETKKVLDSIRMEAPEYPISCYEIHEADLSAARNLLFSKSKGKYIAFFDGDDLFGENYLLECFLEASSNKKPAVYTAANFIAFGRENFFWRKPSSTSKYFSPAMMLLENPFPSQVFVHREVCQKIKYDSIVKGSGYGTEDWHWGTKIIEAGYEFISVPNTLYCYRTKSSGSLLQSQNSNKTTLRPSDFFEPHRFYELNKDTVNRIRRSSNRTNPDEVKRGSEKYNEPILRPPYVDLMPRLFKKYIRKYLIILNAFSHLITKKISKLSKDTYNTCVSNFAYKQQIKPLDEFKNKFAHLLVPEKELEYIWNMWESLGSIDPLLTQDMNTVKTMVEYDFFQKGDFYVAYEYYKLCKHIVDNGLSFKHLIFIELLVGTGEIISEVDTLISGLANSGECLIIMNSEIRSRVSIELPRGAYTHDFSNLFESSNKEYVDRFFLRLIQNLKSLKTINSINSSYAEELILNYNKQIKDVSLVYSYSF